MSAEIRRLTGAGPIFEPPVDVIEKLEMLLEQARAGEIKYLAVAYVGSNGCTANGYAKGCASSHEVVATVARLYHRILMDDDRNG